jgi:hypothetical protein
MARGGTVAEVATLPPCDFCKSVNPEAEVAASFDARTKAGPWANMCAVHYGLHGIARLGTGYGQRLVLAVDPGLDERPKINCPIHGEAHALDAKLECFDALIAIVAADADPYAHL